MTAVEALPLAGLLGLGALHGINPGMGWLFAVAKGLQERRQRAVWHTVIPLAAGHALGIGVTVAVALLAGFALDPARLKWVVAGLLLATGAWHLVRPTHVSAGGMRIGARAIATWSFLMSLAHGAGLMVVPLVLAGGDAGVHAVHAHHAAAGLAPSPGITATLVHTLGYLVVTTVVAVVVYERLGLRLLRRYWFNLDALWAVALVVTAVVVVW
ncbi:MAG TPA: hypothetical protein PKA66_11895 [Gemmatimonadales bacterium]|nr:hypothetical protein [Gemmatimonadales bacterium]